jgi:uncharacterized protein YbbK (DUF523 family)
MNLLVSACLLGAPCRYDGRSKGIPGLRERLYGCTLFPVCPEVLGGLPTPRTPAERVGDRVRTRDGRDVTEAYRRGALAALRIARENGCAVALLKERSPSCGCGLIYDGSFSGVLIPGSGVAAELLRQNGVRVIGESRLNLLQST